jgi:hypothetical protein
MGDGIIILSVRKPLQAVALLSGWGERVVEHQA